MIVLVIGGSGSGKSEYAEMRICNLYKSMMCEKAYTETKMNRLFYIATMQSFSSEEDKKIERHRRLREGKNFETIEQPFDVEKVEDKLVNKSDCFLLECMSNLVANEMFRGDVVVSEDKVVGKITEALSGLIEKSSNAVIVTNNISEDLGNYDDTTKSYISALGKINACLAEKADEVIEVVAGIPITIKGEK
ncbi:MAG: cobinamide kinase [Lachnospiraceae bacterium]|nr:cobinamide kinase [Lachnospiraceae bacterium]